MKDIEQLDKARERVIETIAQNMGLYGVTPSVGRLYGLLYFKNEPMTLDDMKEELGMSKTSMSTAVRHLLELKMVEKVWKKGSRKDLYIVNQDWYQTFADFFAIKWRTSISINVKAMKKSIEELHGILNSESVEEGIQKTAKQDIEKLEHALEYYEWLNRVVDTFESKDIFKHIPK
ncbi:GbsR/MarR family transcriptional regulator [Bacillus sp. HMF5848]|uniref:GbsR/MarR family transcriptional regulator n=1 Tax=Bacillus sp. HMF5848 TaxID=2495421 RepID=UPI000F7A0305|nr:GbsR/MarR family transcriptional regulator [Bacillus sp. HMF5848]RSK26754.1 GbsR/MarR family transcriptional regulator [Bacillus sp. HMF5848]